MNINFCDNKTSFGAKFVYNGLQGKVQSQEELEDMIRASSSATKKVSDFLDFIKSEEGTQLLAQMPEKDTVDLSLRVRVGHREDGLGGHRTVNYLVPVLEHTSISDDNVSTTKEIKHGADIETFKKWANGYEEQKNLLSKLLERFTVNPNKK